MFVYLCMTAVVSYMLGCTNGAIVSSMNLFSKDVREYGSNNAGLTNFYRVFGQTGLPWVLFIDITKSLVSVFLGGLLLKPFGMEIFGKLLAGLFVMFGHMFPIYYKFKGGKGVLCAGVMVFVVDWRLGLIVIGVFILTVLLSRYVSLGSILAGISFPVSAFFFGYRGLDLIMASLCAILMISKHWSNIKRLASGTESKFSLKKKS